MHRPIEDLPVAPGAAVALGTEPEFRTRLDAGHHTQVNAFRQPVIQLHLGQAGGVPLLEAAVVEKTERHRLLEFVDVVFAQQHPRDVGFRQGKTAAQEKVEESGVSIHGLSLTARADRGTT